jgi:NTP pyrophosphatase (non-canonical NTP hydrolase)
MTQLEQLTAALVAFREERDWAQFHDSKNLASAIAIEAAEVNELYLWKNGDAAESIDAERLGEELADVMAYVLLLAYKNNINIAVALQEKMKKNALKYPVEKAKGVATKYTEL